MIRSRRKARRNDRPPYLNVPVHPQIRTELKISAEVNGQTMPERLHEILCREFGLEELLTQEPAIAN